MWTELVERWPIVLVAALLVVQTLRLWWAGVAPRMRLAAKRRRATEGEREAESLLGRAGYRVEARQPRAKLAYALDGTEVLVEVRADLLVQRRGRRFVAEVKTGAEATQLANRATRRQILEYAHAFEVDGVLLVDADAGRVSVVRVPSLSPRRSHLGGVLAVAALLALLVALALHG